LNRKGKGNNFDLHFYNNKELKKNSDLRKQISHIVIQSELNEAFNNVQVKE